MRRRIASLHEPWIPAAPVVLAFVTIDIVLQWNFEGVLESCAWSGDWGPHRNTLWLLSSILLVYCVWAALLLQKWITGLGSTGFLIAAAGVELRYWGDLLLTLPDPITVKSEPWLITAEQAFDPATFDSIVVSARVGGLAACALGLLVAFACAYVDFRARYRRLMRLRGYALRWPRWF